MEVKGVSRCGGYGCIAESFLIYPPQSALACQLMSCLKCGETRTKPPTDPRSAARDRLALCVSECVCECVYLNCTIQTGGGTWNANHAKTAECRSTKCSVDGKAPRTDGSLL